MASYGIIAFLCFIVSLVSAVQNVKVQGANFVNNVTSDRFQIIGVAYASHLHFTCQKMLILSQLSTWRVRSFWYGQRPVEQWNSLLA